MGKVAIYSGKPEENTQTKNRFSKADFLMMVLRNISFRMRSAGDYKSIFSKTYLSLSLLLKKGCQVEF